MHRAEYSWPLIIIVGELLVLLVEEELVAGSNREVSVSFMVRDGVDCILIGAGAMDRCSIQLLRIRL
jgi:hypothetical protein